MSQIKVMLNSEDGKLVMCTVVELWLTGDTSSSASHQKFIKVKFHRNLLGGFGVTGIEYAYPIWCEGEVKLVLGDIFGLKSSNL